MRTLHANLNGGAKDTNCIRNRAKPEARSRSENPRIHYQPDCIRRWSLDRGSSTTNRRSGANQRAYQRMINRRFLIVPPALPGSGHAANACAQQATYFLCLLLDMANIRVVYRRNGRYPPRFAPYQHEATQVSPETRRSRDSQFGKDNIRCCEPSWNKADLVVDLAGGLNVDNVARGSSKTLPTNAMAEGHVMHAV